VSVLNKENLEKIKVLNNEHVLNIIEEYVELLKPSEIHVISDSEEDKKFARQKAIDEKEESPLTINGHTVHYDSYFDQARDKGNTKILVTPETPMSARLNTIDREEGLKEILGFMDGIMKGKQMIIRFFTLGPVDSIFSFSALQITDSWYVAHSEDLLYRNGYEQFKKLNGSKNFLLVVHSAGELSPKSGSDIKNVTKNIDKRRIYIDVLGNRVLSCNNQYAGNSLGLKKLSLRLAIYKCNYEDWLAEHYFIMGIENELKKRKTYFTGAFPSACGKTSTAMLPSSPGYKFTIVGDDIAYLRNINGNCQAVNIEKGVFGIIKDVNPEDDPVIFNTITTPREVIFSNVLINEGKPYWLGMGKDMPGKGMNHSGKGWVLGKKDAKGNEILHAHPNARYTVRISELENADSELDNPNGVTVEGILYGGRDSDTNVPVFESLSWEHGVYVGAVIESETTSATLGAVGVRKNSPMANMDFLVVPIGLYFNNHKKFGEKLKKVPKVYATNYFLKVNGKYTNGMLDKKIWVLWAEGRIHGDYKAIKTPVGLIPEHADLQALFKEVLKKDYTKEDYTTQFSLRIPKLLEKLDRMEKLFKNEVDVPKFFWNILEKQRSDLKQMNDKFGKDVISPFEL